MAHHFHITQHAIDRFIQRHDPTMGREEIIAALQRAAPRAVRLRQRTRRGQEQWAFDDPKVVVVVKRDDGRRDRMVGVTILPRPEEEIPEEELGLIEEAIEERMSRVDPLPDLPAPLPANVTRPREPTSGEQVIAIECLRERLQGCPWFIDVEPGKKGAIRVRANRTVTNREQEEFRPKWRGFQVVIHIEVDTTKAPKAPPVPTPGEPPVLTPAQYMQLEVQRIALERDRLRTERHLANETRQLEKAKALLRRVVNELSECQDVPECAEILRGLGETDAWVLDMAFRDGPGRDIDQDVIVELDEAV